MRYLFIFFLFFISTNSYAEIYECKDSKGSTSYQDHSCDGKIKESGLDSAQTTEQSSISSGQVKTTENNKWEIFDQVDEMTNRKQCVIESPIAYVGVQGSDLLIVSIKITATDEGKFIAALYSKAISADNAPSFHNDIYGLGIKIDKNNFIEADTKLGQHSIGFSFEKTEMIISEMTQGSSASFRVRFWPYDKTFDGHGIPLWDFNRALHSLKTCKGIADS